MTAPALTALDKFIGWISPSAGLKRARARAAMAMVRAYEGAKTGRRTGGWVAGGTSANAEIGPSLNALRNRSRELIRDNGYAAKAASAFVGNAVGAGIVPKLSEGQDVFNRWAKQCDADGQHDFYGLQALKDRTIFESGECLVRLRYRRPEDGFEVPLQLQVLEPDYLDSLKTESLPNGGWIMNGIEFDPIGRRVAYWLFDAHPGDSAPFLKSLLSRRIPASDVLHIYEKTRPGQVRGVPRLAPSMLRMRDLDDYEEAELVRKGIEACFAAFVTDNGEFSEGLTGTGETRPDSSVRIETMSAGMIQYLKPGQEVSFGSPQNNRGYEDYVRMQLHHIAAGAGLTYELLTGDLSQVSYSSIRAGILEFRRQIEQHRWHTLIPMGCDPIMAAWVKTASIAKLVKPATTWEWTPPRWDWVDPLKDIGGELLEIAAGLKPWQEGVRARGYDPETNVNQIKEDQDRFRKAGISVLIDQLALGVAQGGVKDQPGVKS